MIDSIVGYPILIAGIFIFLSGLAVLALCVWEEWKNR